MEKLNFDALGNEVIRTHKEGDIVSHAYLKKLLCVESLKISDFENTEDYNEALKNIQFDYLRKFDALKSSILKNHFVELLSVKGGYLIPTPEYQVKNAVLRTKNKVIKYIRKGNDSISYLDRRRVDAKIMADTLQKQAAWSMINKLAK